MHKALVATLAAAIAIGLASESASALEQPGGVPFVSAEYGNQNNGKRVWMIGDSITDDRLSGNTMMAKIGFTFVGTGRSVHIDASSGSTIIDHASWNRFQWAAISNARAVIVELGTNDVGFVSNWDQENAALAYLDWAAATLANTGKCVIWIGLNGNGNKILAWPGQPWYDNPIWATVFNQRIQAIARSRPNFKYGDYTYFVNSNATYRKGLKDTIHPSTDAAKNELAKWYSNLLTFGCRF